MEVKKRVHEVLEAVRPDDWVSRGVHFVIYSVIIANIVVMAVASVPSVHGHARAFFRWFERISVLIFTVEYVLRLWSCNVAARYASPVLGRLRFAVTPMALVDLSSILPFYLPFTKLDLRFIRAVRLLRVFRILKLGRYSVGLQTLGRVVYGKKEELTVILCVLIVLLVLASSLIYYAENAEQPDRFSSIPASMWWAVVTVTTVGYGDVSPVTTMGKILGGIIAVAGIGMFALPTGILGAAFLEEIQNRKRRRVCPHCGKEIAEDSLPTAPAQKAPQSPEKDKGP